MVASRDENVERAYGRVGAADLARFRLAEQASLSAAQKRYYAGYKNKGLIVMLPLKECSP